MIVAVFILNAACFTSGMYSILATTRNVMPSRVNWQWTVLPELIFVYSRWYINKFTILSRQLVLIELTML